MKERESWTTRIGFILATLGFSARIGNLWRFPYLTGKYGGGIFLLFYMVIVFLLLFPVLFVAAGALEGNVDNAMGGVHWQSLAYSVWEQFMCMAMGITLLVWFRTRFNQQGSLAKKMSAAAYATYIFHRPVITFVAIALSGIQLDMGLKFFLVAPLALALSFLVGYIIKQLPVARKIL